LDRYGVEYLTIEKQSQQRLADAVQSTLESWTVVYEDDAALIARRKEAGE
jgi:transposase-like protein